MNIIIVKMIRNKGCKIAYVTQAVLQIPHPNSLEISLGHHVGDIKPYLGAKKFKSIISKTNNFYFFFIFFILREYKLFFLLWL